MAKVVWGRKRPTVSFCHLLCQNVFLSWLFKLRNLHSKKILPTFQLVLPDLDFNYPLVNTINVLYANKSSSGSLISLLNIC